MQLDNIKKELPVWLKRIWVYFKIFAGIAVFAFILWKIPLTHTIWTNNAYTQYNATQLNNMGFFDNERYLLSALVQSLAATIALVITLSLVAVQLAAQSYSARVIDVYKRNPDMWILLCIYIITIFYGLGLIKIIGLGVLSDYMEGAIFMAYFMGFFAFVCLVPYMWKTLDLLKPSTVIKLLAAEITKEKLLTSLEEDNDEIDEKDSIQPISDIINRAVESNDYETARNGLKAIGKEYRKILSDEKISSSDEISVSKIVFKHIVRIGDSAIDRKNEETLVVATSVLEYCGVVAATNGFKKAAVSAAESIALLGLKTTKKELDYATQEIIDSIKNIEDILIEKDFQNEVMRVYFRFVRIVEEAAFNNLQCTEYAIFLLEEVGSKMTKTQSKRYKRICFLILKKLEGIADYAEKNKQESIARTARDSYFSLKGNIGSVENLFPTENYLLL